MLEPLTHRQRILISRDRIAIPSPSTSPASPASLATVMSNIAYYGFALSADAYAALAHVGEPELATWWNNVGVVLAVLTGDDKKFESYVVYKNFPDEVLAMSEVEYWTRQILMYWGIPNELVTQPEQPRASLVEVPAFHILHLAEPTSRPSAIGPGARSRRRATGPRSRSSKPIGSIATSRTRSTAI